MPRLTSLALALLAAGSAAAQTCSLSISSSGSSLTFAFQGAASSPALMAIGDTEGTTTLSFGPLGSLTLGLAQPFLFAPIGFTDASGAATLTVNVPANIPSADLFAQGVGVTFTPPPNFGLSFCTTAVVPFHIGA
jgi:hypothetical protein